MKNNSIHFEETSMNEVWKDIKGYEGRYQVSNMGRVKSLDRTFIDKIGHQQHTRERILKPSTDRDGYLRVHFSKGSGKRKNLEFIALSAKRFTETQ